MKPGIRSRIGWSRAAFALVSVCVLALVILFGVPETQRVDEPATPGSATAELTPRVPVEPAALEAVLAALVPPASGTEATIDSIAARIVRVGPTAIPVVIGILCGEIAVPDLGSAATRLREPALRSSLLAYRGSKLLAPLLERAGGDASLAVRLTVIELLGQVDDAGALAALFTVIETIEPIHLLRSHVQGRVEDALARQLEQRPASAARLEQKVLHGKPELVPSILRVLAKTPSLRSATIAVRAFGRNTELDLVVSQQLAAMSRNGCVAPTEYVLAAVRRRLTHADARVQRAAIVVLGQWSDQESFAELTEYLSSRDVLLAAAAQASLKTMAGVDLGPDAPTWRAWEDEQHEWWSEHGESLSLQLDSEDPGQVFAALTQMLEHPYFRHAIAERVGTLLGRSDASIFAAACDALVSLRSGYGVQPLVEVLGLADAQRSALAYAALRKLTGLNLPPAHDGWSRALAP